MTQTQALPDTWVWRARMHAFFQERLERIDRSDDPRRQAVEQVGSTWWWKPVKSGIHWWKQLLCIVSRSEKSLRCASTAQWAVPSYPWPMSGCDRPQLGCGKVESWDLTKNTSAECWFLHAWHGRLSLAKVAIYMCTQCQVSGWRSVVWCC